MMTMIGLLVVKALFWTYVAGSLIIGVAVVGALIWNALRRWR